MAKRKTPKPTAKQLAARRKFAKAAKKSGGKIRKGSRLK